MKLQKQRIGRMIDQRFSFFGFFPNKSSSLHLKWSRPDHKRTQLCDLLRGSTLDPVLNSLSRYAALQE